MAPCTMHSRTTAALVSVAAERQEFSMPPKIEAKQATGFAVYALRTVLAGNGRELIDLAKVRASCSEPGSPLAVLGRFLLWWANDLSQYPLYAPEGTGGRWQVAISRGSETPPARRMEVLSAQTRATTFRSASLQGRHRQGRIKARLPAR